MSVNDKFDILFYILPLKIYPFRKLVRNTHNLECKPIPNPLEDFSRSGISSVVNKLKANIPHFYYIPIAKRCQLNVTNIAIFYKLC